MQMTVLEIKAWGKDGWGKHQLVVDLRDFLPVVRPSLGKGAWYVYDLEVVVDDYWVANLVQEVETGTRNVLGWPKMKRLAKGVLQVIDGLFFFAPTGQSFSVVEEAWRASECFVGAFDSSDWWVASRDPRVIAEAKRRWPDSVDVTESALAWFDRHGKDKLWYA